MTLILNGGDRPITIDDILLEEIEADNAEFECSLMVASAPPLEKPLRYANLGGFLMFFFMRLPFGLPFTAF